MRMSTEKKDAKNWGQRWLLCIKTQNQFVCSLASSLEKSNLLKMERLYPAKILTYQSPLEQHGRRRKTYLPARKIHISGINTHNSCRKSPRSSLHSLMHARMELVGWDQVTMAANFKEIRWSLDGKQLVKERQYNGQAPKATPQPSSLSRRPHSLGLKKTSSEK